jgi:hypothetical protein
MKKADLIKELTALIDQYERNRTWGTVEVSFNNGVPVVLKKIETQRLEGDTRNAQQKSS